ncbi:MAG: hypothetical protein NVSMB19_14200 [Vulcanimicrobiaceae bacterium]
MFRSIALGAALAGVLAMTSAAVAQIDPDDSGLGTKRGLAQQNNSGETGSVTLFKRGETTTLVVINLAQQPQGRAQPAHVHRGHACDTLDPKPAFGLAPVVNGVSRTLVKVPESRLLSGNYVVNVHSSAQNMTRYVSCGELY